ncbi:hypothetical protein HAX54_012158, partial [Datura stramonium]|nr:hypothetical protein [Datura stramonium]
GNRSITTKSQLEVETFKDDFQNIFNQIAIRDWGPFGIPVGSYFLSWCGSSTPLTGHDKAPRSIKVD